MKKVIFLSVLALLLMTACKKEVEPIIFGSGTPVVKADSTYNVLQETNITYAEGLSHNSTSTTPFPIPLKLDIYYPDNNLNNRPFFMFIHGGGFTSGEKDKPEILAMANYYASRGWIFASI
ncbi:MAG: hypothetical protein MK066_15090, partial [Crocinitomicaceae bacterium]|nr:hypothetical protein [Crocinitomicaceae bacterium]